MKKCNSCVKKASFSGMYDLEDRPGGQTSEGKNGSSEEQEDCWKKADVTQQRSFLK